MTMIKKHFFVGLLMALLLSINTAFGQTSGKKMPVFDVADALDAALSDNFTWNSIAKNVRMIPLKTEGLIGAHPKVHYFSDDLIIVSDISTHSVFVFDGEGREKVSFSHFGQGPKEYITMTSVNYHEKDSLIMLYDNRKKKLFRFDLRGRCVDVKTADVGGIILQIDSEGDMLSINRAGKSLVSVWDNKLQLRGEYLPFDVRFNDQQKISSQLLSGKGFHSGASMLLPVCSDTVYSVMKQGVVSFCMVKRGGYKCSPDDLKNIKKVMFNEDYLCGEQVHSFSSYFCYITQNKSVVELWDMHTGKLLAWNKGKYEGKGTDRELIWGFRYVFPSGNEIRPLMLDYVNKDCGVFIVQAEECVDDIRGLSIDDNPVILVLEF